MKYTKTQLRGMAQQVMQAKDNGDIRYVELMMAMMLKTGLDYESIEKRIERLAVA